MKKKNLFLAVLLLAGMNCPTITNTADAAATGFKAACSNILWEAGRDTACIGAISALIGIANVGWRTMHSEEHTANEIGFVNVDPSQISRVQITVESIGKRFSKKYTWAQAKNGQARTNFVSEINNTQNNFPVTTSTTRATLGYEVKLILTDKREILLSGELKNTSVELAGNNIAQKLWDNVIKHYLILQSDCKEGRDWKPAATIQRDHFNKDAEIEYSTELSNSHYIHTVGSAGSMTLPLATTAYLVGMPNSWGKLGTYACAYGLGCVANSFWCDAGSGIDLKIPGKKDVITSTVSRDQVDRAIERFIVEQSVINSDTTTYADWITTKNDFIRRHGNPSATPAQKGAIEDEIDGYAFEKQTFLRTDVTTFRDTVSDLTFAYAPVQEELETGIMNPVDIYEAGDLVPDLSTGDLRTKIERLATATGSLVSRVGSVFFGDNTQRRHRRRGAQSRRGHRSL